MLINKFKYFKNRALVIRDFFIDLLFPIECLNCRHDGAWVCSNCFLKIRMMAEERCFGCGRANDYGEICQKCWGKFGFDGLIGAGHYADPLLEKIIKTYKYNFVTDLQAILEKIIFDYLNYYFERINIPMVKGKSISPFLDPTELLIVPVPLHKHRQNWRGFNQAEKLAVGIAQKYNFKLDQTSLERIINNKPQAKLPTEKRLDNIKNAFRWNGTILENKNILLIDDVATTGSTLSECARVLKENGAKKVWCLVVAKK